MKKTLILVVLATLVAFISNMFAQTQDGAKKTEMKKDETKTAEKKAPESKKEVKAANCGESQ